MNKQSRRASGIEVVASTIVGYFVAGATNYFILPFWGYHPSFLDSLNIGLIFVLVSIVRSYIFRRCFEYLRVNNIVT